MKKIILILAVAFSTILLTSCTDESEKIEELNNENLQIFGVDKSKIKRPGSQGS